MNEEDKAKFKCHDNVESELGNNPQTALREFKEGDDRSMHWEDGDDGECLSSNKEQE